MGAVQIREGLRLLLIEKKFDIEKFCKSFYVIRRVFIGDVEEDQSEKEWLETNLKLIVMGVIDPTIFIDALFDKFSLIENRELNKNRRSYKILNK